MNGRNIKMGKKYYLYNVPFVIRNRYKIETKVCGITIASSQIDAKERIKTAYTVIRFGDVKKRSNMEFNKPKTKGIA